LTVYPYADYTEYVRAQRKGYRAKFRMCWAREGNIAFIAKRIDDGKRKLGICHGVRSGQEVAWFAKHLPRGSFVFGTEIGKPAEGMIFRWDFNKRNPAWLEVANFIYSNAFDHSFDPASTLRVWHEQLFAGGIIAIEHSSNHAKGPTETDPVSMSVYELSRMVREAGFADIDALALPEKVSDTVSDNVVVLGRKQ